MNDKKYWAAAFADFPSMPLIIAAQNKTEALKIARQYRREWGIPGIVRLEPATEEEVAEAKERAKKNND